MGGRIAKSNGSNKRNTELYARKTEAIMMGIRMGLTADINLWNGVVGSALIARIA